MLSAGSILRAVPGPGTGEFRPARSLYIHVPFCFHKCHYCDFYSIVDSQDRQAQFADRLVRELIAISPWAGESPLQTIFVGGGTPSLLRVDLWERLLATLADRFDLSEIRAGRGEFTVECNPETVTPDLMAVLRAGGVDRVSVGAQSFNPAHLRTLERWHDPENVPKALAMAAAAGIPRSSLDLIFAVPGQTLAEWETDLQRALALGTEHLSCYNLTYEPRTAMTARLGRGEFTPADEETEVAMYERTLHLLRSRGLERYEVSNYARPGAEARHNLAYWRGEQWLAAGPSASAHVAGHRWKNVPRLDDYLTLDDEGFAPIIDHEPPDAARALAERIMTGLRIAEGLDGRWLHGEAEGLEAGCGDRLAREAERQAAAGLMDLSGGRWRLTEAGFLLADGIAGEFMGLLPSPSSPTAA